MGKLTNAVLANDVNRVNELLNATVVFAKKYAFTARINKIVNSDHYSGDEYKIVNDKNVLHIAIEQKFETIVVALLNAGADPNYPSGCYKKIKPLAMAVKSGSIKAVKYLLEAGAEPNFVDIAIQHGFLEIEMMLLEAGANPNAFEGALVFLAIKQNSVEMLEPLLKANANPCALINAMDLEGFEGGYDTDKITPLYYAISKDFMNPVQVILAAMKKLNKPIPLDIMQYAFKYSATKCIAPLVRAGININFQYENESDQTILHLATNIRQLPYLTSGVEGYFEQSDQSRFIANLLRNGANANPQDKDGNTPLHIALFSFLDINRPSEKDKQKLANYVTTLIYGGANICIKNNFRKSPLGIVQHYQMYFLLNIFEDVLKGQPSIQKNPKGLSNLMGGNILNQILEAEQRIKVMEINIASRTEANYQKLWNEILRVESQQSSSSTSGQWSSRKEVISCNKNAMIFCFALNGGLRRVVKKSIVNAQRDIGVGEQILTGALNFLGNSASFIPFAQGVFGIINTCITKVGDSKHENRQQIIAKLFIFQDENEVCDRAAISITEQFIDFFSHNQFANDDEIFKLSEKVVALLLYAMEQGLINTDSITPVDVQLTNCLVNSKLFLNLQGLLTLNATQQSLMIAHPNNPYYRHSSGQGSSSNPHPRNTQQNKCVIS